MPSVNSRNSSGPLPVCASLGSAKIARMVGKGTNASQQKKPCEFAVLKEEPSVNYGGFRMPLVWSLPAGPPWWHDSPHGSRRGQYVFANCFRGPSLEDKRKGFSLDFGRMEGNKKPVRWKDRDGRIWPNTEPSERARFTREYVLSQFWQTFLDDRFDLENAKQTNAVFSYAVAVMDKN